MMNNDLSILSDFSFSGFFDITLYNYTQLLDTSNNAKVKDEGEGGQELL